MTAPIAPNNRPQRTQRKLHLCTLAGDGLISLPHLAPQLDGPGVPWKASMGADGALQIRLDGEGPGVELAPVRRFRQRLDVGRGPYGKREVRRETRLPAERHGPLVRVHALAYWMTKDLDYDSPWWALDDDVERSIETVGTLRISSTVQGSSLHLPNWLPVSRDGIAVGLVDSSRVLTFPHPPWWAKHDELLRRHHFDPKPMTVRDFLAAAVADPHGLELFRATSDGRMWIPLKRRRLLATGSLPASGSADVVIASNIMSTRILSAEHTDDSPQDEVSGDPDVALHRSIEIICGRIESHLSEINDTFQQDLLREVADRLRDVNRSPSPNRQLIAMLLGTLAALLTNLAAAAIWDVVREDVLRLLGR